MSAGETAYFVLILAAFAIIMAVLAYASLTAWLSPPRRRN
jgi:hypothetical protein